MSKLINFYSQIKSSKKHNPYYDLHKIDLPFRMLVCTASGGGKSNLVLNLLYLMSNTFHKIIIVTKDEEPLYNMLESKLKDRVEIYYQGEIPDVEKLDNGMNGLIIFDDMVLTPNSKIGEMFIRGRKLGFSSIYISQSYFQTPKIIRQNINYIALGRGINKRDLRMILSEYSISLSIEQLQDIYFNITNKHMHFMMIDMHLRNIRHNIEDIIYEF
jgi:DNA helicase HerA-like ATPase